MNNENNKDSNLEGLVFPGQRPEEKVELVIRRHQIILLPYAIYVGVMMALPVAFYILVIPNAMPILLETPYRNIFFLAATIFYGFIWIGAFMVWADYYLDIWIITNQRLMDVEQKGFFHRVVSELDLRRVQDISSNVTGFLPTFFGFGNVEIQSAAETNKFTMESIPHPVTTRRQITELVQEAQKDIRNGN